MYKLLKSSISDFIADDAFTHGAAVAFYAALSLSPVLLLLVYAAGILGPDQQEAVVQQLETIVGPQASGAIQTVLKSSARDHSARSVAGVVTLVVLVFSATGVFAQLQYALNNLWNVKTDARSSVWDWLRKRLASLGMIVVLGFLLITSLGASAVLSAIMTWAHGFLAGTEFLWKIADIGLSFGIFTLLFAFMYRYLPDVVIGWLDVAFGAAATSALFVVGKELISLYLAKSGFSSSYGAAGSLIVLLAWVYYSSLIIFFGAELTQNRAEARGRPIKPNANAVWKDNNGKEEREGEVLSAPKKQTR